MQSETDTDCPGNAAPATNSALLMSKQRVDGIIESYKVAKELALHSRWNNNRDPSASADSRPVFSDENKTSHPNEIGPEYDPQLLMFRRMVCSEDVTKHRLISRDVKTEGSINKEVPEMSEEEQDKIFFENLKKRITTDIKNNVIKKIPIPLPKRSSIVKKRRSLFSIETVNLMKKSRTQMVKRFNSDMDVDHGVFSLENKEKENTSVIVEKNITSKILADNVETPLNNGLNSDTDVDNLCPTPLCVKNSNDNSET